MTLNEQSWKYFAKLPFELTSAEISVTKNNQLLVKRADSLWYFTTDGRLELKSDKHTLFQKFCEKPVSGIAFSKSSEGCFHAYSDKVSYRLSGGVYADPDKIATGRHNKEVLGDFPDEINASAVDDLVQLVPQLGESKKGSSIADLAFTSAELDRCRKRIHEFEERVVAGKKLDENGFYISENNVDFDKLISEVDSVEAIPDSTAERILSGLNNTWSTTTNNHSIELTNEKGESLTISFNSADWNVFTLPWVFNLNGYQFVSGSMAVNKFVSKVFPGFLEDYDRGVVLDKIVRELYAHR